MAYYLVPLVRDHRGRSPLGADTRPGSNWILFGEEALLWTPEPLSLTDARVKEIAENGGELAGGVIRHAWAELAGDGRGYFPTATVTDLIVNVLRQPPDDARGLQPARPGKTGRPGYRVWLGPGVAEGIPLHYEFVAPQTNSKTFVDTFNRGNADLGGSTSSDGLFTWLEVDGTAWTGVSNTAEMASTTVFNTARANADLDTDDHYAQVECTTFTRSAGTLMWGTAVRWTSAANGYVIEAGDNGTGGIPRTYRYDNDANIATSTGTHTSGTLRIEADGDQITGKYNGTTFLGPTTNTAFSGQLRTGIAAFASNSANILRLDNFEAGDLVAGAPATHLALPRWRSVRR